MTILAFMIAAYFLCATIFYSNRLEEMKREREETLRFFAECETVSLAKRGAHITLSHPDNVRLFVHLGHLKSEGNHIFRDKEGNLIG